ncbi:MAG: peptidoglycan-binding protein [Elainella sp. Prado103]|jgi:hypothetical protein|nr:peptidoglycan-binding protein [Elainella sp. Prado103]
MKSLSNHSAFANKAGLSKLKQFKALTRKLSRSALQGFLGLAIVAGVVGLTSDAYAYMRRGAVGPAVSDVQAALGISADGVFGRQTERAVMRFQRKCGLLVDGIVGPETWTALFGSSVPFPVNAVPIASVPSSSSSPSFTPVGNNILVPGIEPPSSVLPPAVIGPYVVIVPHADASRLSAVQQIVPDAVIDGALPGTFINAGGYPNYASAREVAGRLQGFGFDARVDYFERYLEADNPPTSRSSSSSSLSH